MKKFIIYTTFLITLFILGSCASTETTSYTDPDFLGTSYSKVCVFADLDDLKSKQKLENEFVKYFKENGIYAVAGSQLFPPTREWNEDQIQQVLMNQGIDSYLLVDWVDKQVNEKYTPGKVVTETKGETVKKGNKSEYKETTTSRQEAGSYSKEFYSSFESKLIDVKTKRKAWIATSRSESGDWASEGFNLIFESFAEDLVQKLIQDGRIKP